MSIDDNQRESTFNDEFIVCHDEHLHVLEAGMEVFLSSGGDIGFAIFNDRFDDATFDS